MFRITLHRKTVSKSNRLVVARRKNGTLGVFVPSSDETRVFDNELRVEARNFMKENNMEIFNSDLVMKIACRFTDRIRRDVSNFPKSITDALQGVVYRDDSQIIHLLITKELAETEETEITVIPTDKHDFSGRVRSNGR